MLPMRNIRSLLFHSCFATDIFVRELLSLILLLTSDCHLVFSDVVLLDLEYESEAAICVDEAILGKVGDCVELGSDESKIIWLVIPISCLLVFDVFLCIRRVNHCVDI